METGRGKKSKKGGWHLSLGLKEIIFAGLGVAALMMMSFVLGALAGRGDIYRAASSLGLMSPEGPKVAQWTPANEVPGPPATAPVPAAPLATAIPAPSSPATVASAPAPAVAPISQAPTAPSAQVPVAAATPAKPVPVTASLTPLSPPVPAAAASKKKTKTGTIHKDPKAREEEMRRVRQEVVQKLKFQNSFDTGPKARLPKSKEPGKVQAKAQAPPVRVAEYRNSKEAQAKVVELQKKGIKASLRKGKDSKGALFVVYKPGSAASTDAEKLAKKEKGAAGPKKPAE